MSQPPTTRPSDDRKHDDRKQERPKLSLRTRFNAWWEGYDPPRGEGEETEHHAATGDQARNAGRAKADHENNRWGRPLWTASRVEVAEAVWGEGFTRAGGADYVPELLRPLGLNPAMSFLEIGAGLGGTCRLVAEKYECWATGLESSPLLVKLGAERSFKAGLAKRAAIVKYDPEAFNYAKRVDVILSRETFYTIRDKEQLFDGLQSLLKPKGQVLITDYVLDPKADLGKLEQWAEKEPIEPHLWTERDAVEAFAQRNLDLRITEDITHRHQASILGALNAFTGLLASRNMDAETKRHVLDEIELWGRRVAAFSAGLRLVRFYALKPDDGS